MLKMSQLHHGYEDATEAAVEADDNWRNEAVLC